MGKTMKVSYNWLKEIVDFELSPEQLSRALVGAGLEVASVTPRCVPRKVVVARVLSAARHPNADKLTVCSVDTGAGAPVQIVCGAPNVREGLTVPCAVEGAVLGPDMTIKRTKLRGVESLGMLCSERELGISDDHAGLMELGGSLTIGAEMASIVPDDHVIELEVTPNRGDCLSTKGVAREIAAAVHTKLRPLARTVKESGGTISDYIAVEIADTERCPRYMGRLVRKVKIGPSPAWLKNRLSACGMRPINNVVDITN